MSPLEGCLYALGVVLAVLEGLQPSQLWSFEVAGIPRWIFPCLIIAALLGVFWLRRAETDNGSMRADPSTSTRATASTWMATFGVAWVVLWLLRCRESYGDFNEILRSVHDGVLFHKREPLSPTLFLVVHETLGRVAGWAPLTTIQVVTTSAGAAGTCGLVTIAARIAGDVRSHRMVVAAVFLSGGTMQLFAGYVENYTVPTVLMLFAITSALATLDGEKRLLRTLALWTLSCMFHLSGLVFVPAFVWLAWCDRGRLRSRATMALLQVTSVTLLPLATVYVLMQTCGYRGTEESGFGGGDSSMLVPLFDTTGYAQYLFLRPDHLWAIANEQLLVAPLGLAMLIGGLVCVRRKLTPAHTISGRALVFLALVACGFFGLTVVWNPDWGPLLDWDLFGAVGFYLNIAGVALVARALSRSSSRFVVLLAFVTMVNLSRALPFILHNHG